MRTILPYINHPFFVKDLAPAGLTIDKIPEGNLGIVDDKTNLTVSELSDNKVTLVKMFNGEPMFLGEYFDKKHIRNIQEKVYTPEKVNKWKTTIDHCTCIDSLNMNITVYGNKIYETTGNNEEVYGFVQNKPAELDCFCGNCSGKHTYGNHLFTLYVYRQIMAMNSPYFTAEVEQASGAKLANEKAIVEFIEANKAVNTDDDPENDSELLSLIIVGKPQSTKNDLPYRRLTNTPIRIVPTISIDGVTAIEFKELQKPQTEIGAGIDLMQEEWDNYNFYTTNNYYWDMDKEFITEAINYQFNKDKKYDTLTFVIDTDKQYTSGTNEQKSRGIILGAETGSGVLAKLTAIFE